MTHSVETGDVVRVGNVEARCIHIPGHTLGAVAYFVDASPARVVFTGDTLFCAGCGRLFEGTPAQMHESLSRLLELPGDTRVHCGHEYTESNLRFGRSRGAVEHACRERTGARDEASRRRTTHDGHDARRGAARQSVPSRLGSREIRTTLGITADRGRCDDVRRDQSREGHVSLGTRPGHHSPSIGDGAGRIGGTGAASPGCQRAFWAPLMSMIRRAARPFMIW